MASEIKAKFGTATAFTITLASLATSTTGVGRQTTLVDNSTTRYARVLVYGKIRQGTSPTGSKGVNVHLIRGDGTRRSDAAGASDAAHTVLNAQPMIRAVNKAAPSTGDDIYFDFVIDEPGPEFGLSINHDTGVNLDADAGDHYVYYVGVTYEAQ